MFGRDHAHHRAADDRTQITSRPHKPIRLAAFFLGQQIHRQGIDRHILQRGKHVVDGNDPDQRGHTFGEIGQKQDQHKCDDHHRLGEQNPRPPSAQRVSGEIKPVNDRSPNEFKRPRQLRHECDASHFGDGIAFRCQISCQGAGDETERHTLGEVHQAERQQPQWRRIL